MQLTSISRRERVRTNDERLQDGTEYRCGDCGAWSHIDDWSCLGYDDDDGDEYTGTDAIRCPHCGTSQRTPGTIAIQTELLFEEET